MPSLGSVLPRWKPSRVVSIRNAVIPRAALSGSVIANSTMYFATGPEVIQLFLPLTTNVPSACFTARQRMAVESEPDCGSVSATAPISTPSAIARTYFCFCASVPCARQTLQNRELVSDMQVEAEASAAAISTISQQYDHGTTPH